MMEWLSYNNGTIANAAGSVIIFAGATLVVVTFLALSLFIILLLLRWLNNQ